MHTKAKISSITVAFWLAALQFASAASSAEVVSFGGSWAYFLGTQEASTPVGAWRLANFDDSSWARGQAPLGYANPPNDPMGWEASIATTLPSSAGGNYLSVFFRSTFVITNKADITGLGLSLHVDDAYVAWINGVELGRFGVPDGVLPYNTAAPVSIDEGQEKVVSAAPNALVNGTNVLAIQVFQAGLANNDLLLDAALTAAIDAEPPLVTTTVPVPGGVVRDLKFISVVFSEPVTNVDLTDLLINDAPATNFVAMSTLEYQFRFPQPPTGQVTVAWASAHGIVDLATTPHSFGGGTWTYTLDPNAGAKTVVISEFLADNEHGLEDEDGNRSDWIELYNPGPLDANLDGWFLTDTSTNLTVWRFPAVTLAASKYMLVWASQKNKTNPLAPLHTNFKLAKDAGSYLALVDPGTNVISAFTYPAQVPDSSYGRDAADPSITGPFVSVTPGRENPSTGTGFSGDPTFSLESGVYVYTNAPLVLAMSGPAGATIRFTTNGSLPTASSPIYTGPVSISANMVVKARVFQAGLFPGPILSRNFVLLDNTTRAFSSNLPVLILSSAGGAISSDLPGGATNRTKGTFVVYDTFRGRASFERKPDFLGNAQFEGFGQTSAGWPKRPYNVEINDDNQNDMAVSILGMPAEADWKLRNPWTDKCMMNDFMAFELFEQMGRNSLRRRLVEVFRDENGGRVTYPLDYYGVMLLVEKIEVGKDRVDIAELTPSVTNEPAISGGYMFKKDKDSTGDLNFNTPGGSGFQPQGLKLHEPKPREVNNNINHPQMVWLRNYLSRFESSLYAADWLTRTGTNHYSNYIDVDSFVDQHWIVEFPKQIDGYRLSSYYSKDRNGKIKAEPIWDWNLAFGNADYLDGGHTNTWYWGLVGDAEHIWLRRLITGSVQAGTIGDLDFRQKIADRWGTLRTNVFNGERLLKRIDEVANLLTESAGRNYIKYTNLLLGVYHWPNPNGKAGGWDVDYVNPKSYAGIITEMKKWTWGRYLWCDGQFVKAPFMTVPPGPVQPGTELVMSGPGTVYYTLDGTDPRAPGGGVAAGALVASGAIPLNSNARVFARSYVNPPGLLWSAWSPPSIGTYVVATPQLAITEIMYHPTPAAPPTAYTDEDFEYIELKNVGSTSLNLGGYSISGGIDFTFSSLQLDAGARVVVVKNQAAFNSRYGSSATVAGQYNGALANDGNRLALWGRYREPIQDFSYDDDWYPITDGFGFSLVVVDEHATPANYGLASNWRPSGTLNGKPGQDDGAPSTFPQVVVSEVLTHTDSPPPTDTIELSNLGTTVANIEGWYLTDDFRNPKKYRIPAGRTIAAGGQTTFTEADFNVAAPGNVPFALSALGDEVYVFSADAAGNLTGYHHGYQFGAQRNGVTFGRYVNSVGADHFVAMASPSLGAPNGAPAVGPVVISEIMYRPQDVVTNGGYWNNTEDEYIELRNITASPVSLFDPVRPASRWKLDQDVQFTFPPETTIPGNGTLVVVNFNPNTDPNQTAAFRSKYGISGGVQLVGPYKGNLDNSDGNVSLYMPDTPLTNGVVPLVLVDRVHYSDKAPWPPDADGVGQTLQRKNVFAYGDDPANWTAVGPSPGSDYVPGGNAPTITAQPAGATASDSGLDSATFTANAAGPGPLRYQWLFNGSILPGGTDKTLVVRNITPAQAGSYQMVALNPYGSAISAPATLTVLIAPKITQYPVAVSLRGSTNAADFGYTTNNATFTVAAVGSGQVRFQWRYNGQEIPGATGPSLIVPNVGLAQEGLYDVVVRDDIISVTTPPVRLSVMVSAVYLVAPANQVVASNRTFTAAAVVRGNPAPYRYEWREISSVRGSNTTALTTNYFTSAPITNRLPTATTAWRLLVYNEANPGGTLAAFTVTALADTDQDGIPDVWETPYGLDPNNPNDRDVDSDGDGMNNYAEYIAGTDPTNPSSYLKVEQVTSTGPANIQFQALANRTYTVEYKDGLDSPVPWKTLSDVIAKGVDWSATVLDPAPSTNRFYRLGTPKK